jgi:ring-1,2-phenylacetyl-CoA epoxidase subunit PaaC
MAYHVRHCAEWVVRLGDSTAEARRRMEAAIARFWPYTGELFSVDAGASTLIEAGIAIDPETIRSDWHQTIDEVFTRATLSMPGSTFMHKGGRAGQHSEHLGHLLADLQYMQRAVPDAVW